MKKREPPPCRRENLQVIVILNDLNFSIDVMKSLFLHGYGWSIRVKDTRLIFTQGTQIFPTEKREIIESLTRAYPFDKVVIQGKGFKLYTLTFG